MSLLLITNPPSALTVSSQWTDFVTRSNGALLGHGLSIPIFTLTNWDSSTTKPAIAAGSIIEVGGSLYQADVDTALTDEAGLVDGTVHIKLVPSGAGASVVPTLTNGVIPAWDANKAGWYTTDNKYLPFEMTKTSAVYTVKSEYINQDAIVKTGSQGEIYDKNGNEVLSLMVEYQKTTGSLGSDASGTKTLTFAKNVLGIANVRAISSSTAGATQGDNSITIIDISISGTTVTFTITNSRSATIAYNLRCTAFIEG